jgi:hypothetical protein
VPENPDEWKAQGIELIPRATCEEMRRRIRARAYIECSARRQINLREVFEEAILTVLHPETEVARSLPRAADRDRGKRQAQVALLGTEVGKRRIDTFINLSVRSLTDTEPSMRDGSVEFTCPFSRKSVSLLATRLDLPFLEDLAPYDFVIFVVSFADSNLVRALNIALVGLEPSGASTPDWIFVTVDREVKKPRAEAVSQLKNWVQRMNGQLLDASLRSGVGLHEVFGHIGKSWLGK